MTYDDDDTPIDVPWDEAEGKSGVRFATVRKVKADRSKKGDTMLVVELELEGGGAVTDWVMLGGPGLPIGTGKLKHLGVEKGARIVPSQLVGFRVEVYVVSRTGSDGVARLGLVGRDDPAEDIEAAKALGFQLGYRKIVVPTKAAPTEDIPF